MFPCGLFGGWAAQVLSEEQLTLALFLSNWERNIQVLYYKQYIKKVIVQNFKIFAINSLVFAVKDLPDQQVNNYCLVDCLYCCYSFLCCLAKILDFWLDLLTRWAFIASSFSMQDKV